MPVDTDDARRIKRKLYSRLNQFSLEEKSGKVRSAGHEVWKVRVILKFCEVTSKRSVKTKMSGMSVL